MSLKPHPLLVALLGIDVAFFAFYFSGQLFGVSLGQTFVLSHDGSAPELYQYCKELTLLVLFFFAFLRERNVLYMAWTCLFGYLFLDDALMIREWLGNVFAGAFITQGMFGLSTNDLGELLALAMFGALLLPFFVMAHASSDQAARKTTWLLLPWLALLMLWGGVFDMVHSLFAKQPMLDILLGFTEDGGEMIVMSFMVWVVYRWYLTSRLAPWRLPHYTFANASVLYLDDVEIVQD